MPKPNLIAYCNAGNPVIAVETADEDRAIRQIITDFPDREIHVIAQFGGLRTVTQDDDGYLQYKPLAPEAGYPGAFGKTVGARRVLIVLDWQHVAANAMIYRTLRLHFDHFKMHDTFCVLVGPRWNLPVEIAHLVPVLEMPLPTRAELRVSMAQCLPDGALDTNYTADQIDSLLDSASGLTQGQAENSFALSLAELGTLSETSVLTQKMQCIKQTGFLEWYQPLSPDSLGGLGELRRYFLEEVIPARESDLLRVRGVIAVGVSGTGKSHSARVAGALLGWPVLRGDISSLKNSYVGKSEENMRGMLRLAEAVAPCILFLDEIEKAVSGHGGQGDGGVSGGMLGMLLTWLQDHNSSILTFATCNDYSALPAELTRTGRFDERFFVDIPSSSEREDVARIKLSKFGCSPELAEYTASVTNEFTGAEIEGLVKSAARRTNKAPTEADILRISKEIKPIARVRKKEVDALREWGNANLRVANTIEATTRATRKVVTKQSA